MGKCSRYASVPQHLVIMNPVIARKIDILEAEETIQMQCPIQRYRHKQNNLIKLVVTNMSNTILYPREREIQVRIRQCI